MPYHANKNDRRIAVIGLSARYAGGVTSPDDLWTNLKAGVDPIRDFPDGRWDRGYLDARPEAKGRSYIYAGGYLDDVAGFDAEFFGISPREAQEIDPQQRLLLELAWEAFEDAGIAPPAAAGSATGVFVGLSARDYGDYHGDDHINAYTNLGLSLSIASNRVSYVLDLKGPSLTVDTACSSGMVALHQAVQSLQRGECTMALAGAANLLLAPRTFIGFSKASMLSPAGRCTSFDAGGAGYVRAEGGGFLLLKPLADAERDGDTILGVIAATGVNSDGRTMGIALPNGEAQAALLERVYAEAGVAPADVYYLEAHGTGTAVGDPIECGAIARVLGGERRGAEPLRIGSIKSNVGHLEPAAGIAGLTKVLLALKHREIPANLHFVTPNPKIDFAGWKLDVVARHHPLPERDRPLVFGVNSFGFGGTNGHAVIEEYRPRSTVPAAAARPGATPWQDVLVISAQSPAALDALARQWQQRLACEATAQDTQAAARWEALRANALHGRAHLAHRLAIHASSAEEAADRLSEHLDGRASFEVATGRAASHRRAPVAWVYAGNGPQWWGMGREMMAADATYRGAVESVDAIFRGLAGWSLIDELMRDAASSRMALTEVAQPTLFALQVGLTTVLRAAGLEADAVIGHSVGEAAAAWASGALSLEQATRVIHQRSLAQSATAGLGRMAALGIGADEARAAIAEVGGFLELAAVNSPSAVTVAGDPARLEILVQRLVDAGRFARVLALDYPFHTRAMDGIRDGLLLGLAGLEPGTTQRAFVSTVEGRTIDGAALGAEYWWRNVREPVAFEAGVSHLLAEHGIAGFIEIGPHPVLRDYLLQTAKARNAQPTVLTTLRRPRGDATEPELALLRQTVCAAYANGLGDPTRLSPAPGLRVPLPLYPWQRQRHWRGEHSLPGARAATRRDHPLLGWRTEASAPAWLNPLDRGLLPWLADHVIQDAAVFPAAGYIEAMLAAAAHLHGEVPAQIEDMDIVKPLVLPQGNWPLLQLRADPADGTVEISSRADADVPAAEATHHIRARITRAEPAHRPQPADLDALWQGCPVEAPRDAHVADTVRRGMHYGPAFQGLASMRLEEALPARALGWIEQPDAAGDTTAYRSHPALLDACLQLLITLMAARENRSCAYIPVRVGRLRWFAALPRRLFCEVRLVRDSARSGQATFTLRDESGACVMALEDTRFQKVDFDAGRAPAHLADRWHADPTAPSVPTADAGWPDAAAIAARLPQPADDTARAARLDALAGAYAAEALRALQARAGIDAPVFTIAALQRRARVAAEFAPLLRALFAMALADGRIALKDAGVAWTDAAHVPAATLWHALLHDAPECHAEAMLLAQVGEQLPALLCGEIEPPLPASAERLAPALETLLDGAPFSATGHALAAAALAAIAQRRPAGRALRVLELHAGLGGCTAAALSALPHEHLGYAVSEREAGAVERLLRRLDTHPALRGLALDLADDAAVAAQRGRFDVLLCADGFAAAGLAPHEALQRAARLVAPGGLLVMLAPRPGRLATFVFGSDPAWWRGDQPPLLDDGAWQAEFVNTPWAGVQQLGAGALTLVIARHAADADASPALPAEPMPTQRWLLLDDPDDTTQRFTGQLADALARRGQTVQRLTVRSDDADDLAARIAAVDGEPDRIVHLAGLCGEAAHPLVPQPARCLPLIALARLPKPGATLAVVTRGATPAPGGGTMDPAQATAWGMARVLANEQPGLGTALIDLHAPLDAALAERLAAELLAGDAESEVLLDATGRWVNRVEPVVAPPQRVDADSGRAVRLFAAAQGGLDALHLRPVPRRAPAAGEVEIAVRAAGLNFRDVLWAMNMLPEEAVENGFSGATIGMECAGEVVAVGDGVQGLAVGDRVIGFASGCFASHVTTAAGAVARMPEGLSFDAAATLPTAFLTAQYALVHLARLEPGERVLIHGAAGGVGLAAVQIAKLRGAVVFGTAGSVEKRRLLKLYGVDHVLDSRSLAFADDVLALTNGEGVDVLLNSLAGEAITKNLQILRPFGRMLEIGKRDFYANSRIGLRPFRNNLSYFGIDADTLLIERPDLARKVFAEVAADVAAQRLRPLPYQALPIGRAARAFRLMQQSRHVGKIVVSLPGRGEPLPAATAQDWRAKADGTWLVTGGLGGFGLASARWLVERGVRAVALVSRRGATTDEARAGIAAMEAAGAQVRAYAADTGRADDVARVLADIRATLPPLRGVLHAAMVLDDAPLQLLDRERLMRVLEPKLAGAWELHRQTLTDPLEAFVLYSSASMLVGNPGQGNYVAANAYLHAMAQWRRAQGLPALSVAWGAISDVGVVTRTEGLAEMIERRSGMATLTSAEALEGLGRALAANHTVLSIAPLDMRRIGEMLPAARSPRMAAMAPALAAEADAARETLAQRWPRTPAEERRPIVLEMLREQLARILGSAASQVDIERPLADMGLDSLMAVELASALEREVGRPVSVMQMIQASSAAAVADTLLASLEPAANG